MAVSGGWRALACGGVAWHPAAADERRNGVIWPVLILHAGATFCMTGLIWFVQVVHYPLMAAVGPEGWRGYHAAHTSRTTLVVAPLMLIEAITALGAAWLVSVPALAWLRTPTLIGLVLLAVVWGWTFLWMVPLHARLGEAQGRVRELARSNWVRTAAWSLRSAVAAWMIARATG